MKIYQRLPKLSIFTFLCLLKSYNSCKKDESAYPDTIIGKWCIDKDEEQVVEFSEDGTGRGLQDNQIFSRESFTFKIDGKILDVLGKSYEIEFMKNNTIKLQTYLYAYSQGNYTKYTLHYVLTRIK